MKKCPYCEIEKPDSEFGRNNAAWDGLSCYCKLCRAEIKKERRASGPSSREFDNREYNARRRLDPIRQAAHLANRRLYNLFNVETVRASVAKSTAKFKAEFPEEYAAKHGEKAMRREAEKIQRTPAWSSPEACRVAYRLRVSLQNSTGIRQAVDHSVPLRGKLVSGFHVPENLVVIPFADNATKGNRFDPMTYEWWPECFPKLPNQ